MFKQAGNKKSKKSLLRSSNFTKLTCVLECRKIFLARLFCAPPLQRPGATAPSAFPHLRQWCGLLPINSSHAYTPTYCAHLRTQCTPHLSILYLSVHFTMTNRSAFPLKKCPFFCVLGLPSSGRFIGNTGVCPQSFSQSVHRFARVSPTHRQWSIPMRGSNWFDLIRYANRFESIRFVKKIGLSIH